MPARPAAGKKLLQPTDDDTCKSCGTNPNAEMLGASISAKDSGRGKIEGKELCSWFEISYLVKEVARQLGRKKYDCILGISNGGIIPARLLAEELQLEEIQLVPVRNKKLVAREMPKLEKGKKYLVVDDIYDTGATYDLVSRALRGYDCAFAFCMSRYEQSAGVCGRILLHNRWIVFPWETS